MTLAHRCLQVAWQAFETTPLFEGSVNGYKRIVRLLIEHGAKVRVAGLSRRRR